VLKKKLWIIGLSLTALLLSPALQAAAADVKTEEAKSSPASKDSASPAASTAKTDDKADDKAASAPTAGHKSAAIAGGLAFFPGVAVHGAGHMYAGSWMKGLGLLAIETASVAVAVNSVGGISGAANVYSGGKSVPTDISAIEINAGAIVVSSMAFLWTWFDDMAGAPIAVSEYNKIQDQKTTAQLQLTPKGDGAVLALSTNF
jgi:hypothetical protein